MIPASQWSAPWLDSDTCTKHQAAQAEIDLRDWQAGKPHVAFDAFCKVLLSIREEIPDLLEVGCGCGYYRVILKCVWPRIEYMGADISSDMIDYACKHFGNDGHFIVVDDRLPFVDGEFSCVCLAAVIQHCADWQATITEAARVSSKYVLIHRVQATTGPTREFVNPAYGTELPTRENNIAELLDYCENTCGVILINQQRWGESQDGKCWNGSYLFKKT